MRRAATIVSLLRPLKEGGRDATCAGWGSFVAAETPAIHALHPNPPAFRGKERSAHAARSAEAAA